MEELTRWSSRGDALADTMIPDGPEAWDDLTEREREEQHLEYCRLASFEKRLERLELESYRRSESLIRQAKTINQQ